MEAAHQLSADEAYAVLGLQRGASLQHIRRTYLKLSIRFHPDKQRSSQDDIEGTNSFVRINAAYTTLLSHRVARLDRDWAEREAGLAADIAAGWSRPAKRGRDRRSLIATRPTIRVRSRTDVLQLYRGVTGLDTDSWVYSYYSSICTA